MNSNTLVVAGIGTGIGKTLIAAILTEALEADYWKPVQAGNPEHTDTDEVRSLISNNKTVFHPEAYRLNQPLSPHAAAKLDNIEIDTAKLDLPVTQNRLIIELAGGLMVPLNKNELNSDLLVKWNAPVVLVSQNYLGSINHTLLSVDLLKNKNITIAGIIFNGEPNIETEKFILHYTAANCIANIQPQSHISKSTVTALATKFAPSFKKWLL
jgi:dethiobiotin synthetase